MDTHKKIRFCLVHDRHVGPRESYRDRQSSPHSFFSFLIFFTFFPYFFHSVIMFHIHVTSGCIFPALSRGSRDSSDSEKGIN